MDLLILAKSDKKCNSKAAGFCIAGVTEREQWIRLVSDRNGDAVKVADCKDFKAGDSIHISDDSIISCPLPFQPENCLVSDFKRICVLSKSISRPDTSTDSYIFLNNRHFLHEHEMQQLESSLVFVTVSEFSIYQDEYKKFKARFVYKMKPYVKLSITAPGFYSVQDIGSASIVLSLPPTPYRMDQSGECRYYKFVAAVYPKS